MGDRTPRGGRQDAGREDAKRQQGGSPPLEDVVERALEHEPGVEWHAGEDAGEVPDREDDEGEAPAMGTSPP